MDKKYFIEQDSQEKQVWQLLWKQSLLEDEYLKLFQNVSCLLVMKHNSLWKLNRRLIAVQL